MKTTTKSSWVTILFSWIIALGIFAGVWWYLCKCQKSDTGSISLHLDKPMSPGQKPNNINKQDQLKRPLPHAYADQLVKKSDVMVKKELQSRLEKFMGMSKIMKQRKNELLKKIETRKLPPTAPSDANNTSQARKIPLVNNSLGANASAEEIYNLLREYEHEIQSNYLAVNAAKQSLSQGLSFPEVYKSLSQEFSRMPTFNKLVNRQTNGGNWDRMASSSASGNLKISSTGDLNNYRELLGQISRQSGLSDSRLQGLFGMPQSSGGMGYGGSGASGSGNGFGSGNGHGGSSGYGSGNGNGNGSGIGYGGGNGQGGTNYTGNGEGSGKTQWSNYQGSTLSEDLVKAQALPGRRFSKSAKRKGWLYINTWYMIGPWGNYGRNDFSIVHPPEVSVDFDAVYRNGLKGVGTEETDAEPVKIVGRVVRLNGTLRWKFMQSESMHNIVPVTTNHSTYYAYTELYFDEATTMLVAIGTDDCGRVWINGKDVWQDTGSSWYHIDEHIQPFHFRKGWNKVLVRLENNDGPTGFSFLIIPKRKYS